MTEISEEAIEAGANCAFLHPGVVRMVLTASLPFLEAVIRADQREIDAQVIDARVAELRAAYGGYLGQSGAISATVWCASAIRGGKDG